VAIHPLRQIGKKTGQCQITKATAATLQHLAAGETVNIRSLHGFFRARSRFSIPEFMSSFFIRQT
jgi:hypothetical protein